MDSERLQMVISAFAMGKLPGRKKSIKRGAPALGVWRGSGTGDQKLYIILLVYPMIRYQLILVYFHHTFL